MRDTTGTQENEWRVTHIPSSHDEPSFTYTRGFNVNFKHPDLIVFGLDSNLAYSIFRNIAAEIKIGKTFCNNNIYENILEGLPIAIRGVHSSRFEMYFADALEECRLGGVSTFMACQVFWPDRSGAFPFQLECNIKTRQLQPRLDIAATPNEIARFRSQFGIED